ncbi:MAG TPA: metallopeptidase TldD-related protein [Micropepsaceae bacterium]|nr:metallopeptidase TldD-related protein [Micropepsaceae bacterium]
MQDHFLRLADFAATRMRSGEGFLLRYSGEQSSFIRFNRAAVRQSGTVEQHYLSIELFNGRRHLSQRLAITGHADDQQRLHDTISGLREMLSSAPEDPHFLVGNSVHSTDRNDSGRLLPDDAVIPAILNRAAGKDFVGFYASGPIHHGFANSFGQRNWDTVHTFSLDGCFYLQSDKAVKLSYGGREWDDAEFAKVIARAQTQLSFLERTPKTIAPGGYRAFLSPAAMEELLGMLGWGGFGLAAHRTGTTPLIRLARGEITLNPMVHLIENTKAGLAPTFQDEGFVKPASVTLIENGQYKDCLASPRSAGEFGAPHNGANSDESPAALEMAPGQLADDDILPALGTGLLIGNLWYLNYSDRNACRLTGMTRFATFWVENGAIAAPVNVMRFDDSIYRILGENLIALTSARDWRLSTDTYDARSTASMHIPGALIDDFRLTL